MNTRIPGQISVIVPVYNVSSYICECVDSILNQTYKNLEVILVDDGSTDDSLVKCNGYLAKDSRVKVIHQENAGVSEARNTGIENASGEFIMFLDSDDFYTSKAVYCQLVEKMNTEDVDIVVFGFSRLENGELSVKSVPFENQVLSKLECFELLHEKSQRIFLPLTFPGAKLYKAELFDYPDVRFVKGRYAEDALFVHHVLEHTEKIYWLNEHYYVWRIVEDSRSHAKYSVRYMDLFLNFLDRLETLSDYASEPFYQLCIEQCFDSGIRHFCKALRLGLIAGKPATVYREMLIREIDHYLPLYHLSAKKRIKWSFFRKCPDLYFNLVKGKAKLSKQ